MTDRLSPENQALVDAVLPKNRQGSMAIYNNLNALLDAARSPPPHGTAPTPSGKAVPHTDDLNDPVLRGLAALEPGQCWMCSVKDGHAESCPDYRPTPSGAVEALRFYAEPTHWSVDGTFLPADETGKRPMCGKRARTALAAISQGGGE